MLVLICGDRDWTDYYPIKREIVDHKLDPKTDVIMHGNCSGADRIAGEIALANGFSVKVFGAQWHVYGAGAGPIRNKLMLDQKPDLVLAFHPNIGISKGTSHMIGIARAAGVKVEIFAS